MQKLSFKICLLALKALTFGELRYLADLLKRQNVRMGMGLRTFNNPFRLEVPRLTSEPCFSEKTVLYTTPHLLNRWPVSLKELDFEATFNSKLKTFSSPGYGFENL